MGAQINGFFNTASRVKLSDKSTLTFPDSKSVDGLLDLPH